MKTLKFIVMIVFMSMFITSCTDLINSDDDVVMTKIENVKDSTVSKAPTGEDGDSNTGNGKDD